MNDENKSPETFELRFMDLTKDAQQRLIAFDPEIPDEILIDTAPIWTARKVSQQSNTDGLRDVIKAMLDDATNKGEKCKACEKTTCEKHPQFAEDVPDNPEDWN